MGKIFRVLVMLCSLPLFLLFVIDYFITKMLINIKLYRSKNKGVNNE